MRRMIHYPSVDDLHESTFDGPECMGLGVFVPVRRLDHWKFNTGSSVGNVDLSLNTTLPRMTQPCVMFGSSK